MFNRVLVGADNSPTAKRAIEAATEMVLMSGGALHIVTAFSAKATSSASLPGEFKDSTTEGDAEAALQILSFISKGMGVEPTLHLAKGDPAEVIIETAAKMNADLIVVGNRGMKGTRRVLGSVPNSVAHGASCSVAIIDTSE
ncbi:MAG TPA: universal stress protein [Acidimicrobiales bacterium]|nr:universal stress protein [Acidimicrobiales bacterium]